MWSSIKFSFARDFKDANGNGITPFIIHEVSWASQNGGCAGDSSYQWGAAFYGPNINQLGGNYTCQIGPGYDDRLIRSPGNYTDRQRQQTLTNWYNGTYGGRRVWEVNMLTMETWNELWEGTAIDRCVDYPDPWSPGTYLPETFYMDTFHNLLQSSIGTKNYDATFLKTWQIPIYLTRGVTQVPITVRNDGMLPWDPSAGCPVRVGLYLEDGYGNYIPGTDTRAYLPNVLVNGQEADMSWTVPSNWPTGTYYLRLDMVVEGWSWFSWQGDTPVKSFVIIN